ncbi:hypothetical protein EYR38_003586 [Pleurotus pulmonarius]|nr:hypothetical protein EYR38_003586 [Pleurotus pulmonarius]
MPSQVCGSVASAADQAYDYVIVTTKAVPELKRTPEILSPLLSPEYTKRFSQPTYVLLQNGLNVERDLHDAIHKLDKGKPSIIGTALYVGTNLAAGNVVEHNNVERLSLGVYRHDDHTTTENSADEASLLQDLGSILQQGGSAITIVPEIQRVKFSKNFWNLCFASFATLTGYTLPSLFRGPPASHGEQYEPMLLDARRSQPMEVEVIVGEVVRMGKQYKVDMPHVEMLYALLLVKQNQILGRIAAHQGVQFKSKKFGEIKDWKPDRLCSTVTNAADQAYDYVVVATKAVPELRLTPEILSPLLSPEYTNRFAQPTYVLMQNGLNVEKDLYNAIRRLNQEKPSIVSRAMGFPDSPDGLPSSTAETVFETLARLNSVPESSHVPSMLLDARRSQPMEVEVIVRMGKKYNVDMPHIDMLYALLLVKQNQVLGRLEARGSSCGPTCATG